MKKRLFFISFLLFIAVFFLFFTQREVKAYCSGTYTCIQTALDCRDADGDICTAGTLGCTCTIKSISQGPNDCVDWEGGCYASGCGTGTTSVINNCNSQPPVTPTPTSTPIPPTPTPMPPSGECDSNCRDVPDSTCHGGTCGICQKRTNIHQCDGNGDGTYTNCSDTCVNDNSCDTSCATTYPCARCSIINGCEWTQFQSNNADCSTVDSAVTRTTNCNPCTYISDKDNSRCAECPANCKDITGLSEIVAGDTYEYKATFENGYGGFAPVTDCALAIMRENSCPSNIFYFWDKSGCTPGTRTYSWTPNTTGYFTIDCRAWNDGFAECRGNCVTSPPVYACVGPGASKTVQVIEPSPTPTPTNSPPSAPTLSSPADGSICQSTSLTLGWNDVSSWGLCLPITERYYHYLVYVDDNSDFSSPVVNGATTSSTSYSVSGLSPGTIYYWKVEANNGCLDGAYSKTWSFTTAPNPPAAPTCVSASCVIASAPEAKTTCMVDWSNVSGASSYAVRVDDAPDSWSNTCAWTYPGDVCIDGLASSIYSWDTGQGGHTYKPWFHAVDNCNQGSPAGYCPNFTALACPLPPSGLTANRTLCDVTLNWTDNSTNEESFMVQRALDGGGFADLQPPVAAGAGTGSIITTTDTGVFCGASPAASAQYRVSALYSTCPRSYATSDPVSCPLTVTFNPPSPSVVSIIIGQTLDPAFTYSGSFECGAFSRITVVEVPTTPPGSLLDEVTDEHTVQGNAFAGNVKLKAKTTQTGTTKVRVTAYLNPGDKEAGHADVTVNVAAPPAWWQTKDGDVHGNSGITCLIPDLVTEDNFLSLEGDGGDPGVVSYGGSIEMGAGDVSSKGWQAQTTYHGDEINYDYLMNRLNVDTSKTLPGQDIPGSGTYYAAGSIDLNGKDVGGDKVIIFVDGDAIVVGDIKVGKSGFFALIAGGNITFDADVKIAQGFYLADGILSVASGASLFEGEGSFIGWGGVSLKRDLGETGFLNLTPSEIFTFRPDLLLNAPKEFLFTPFVFQEVAP